MKKQKANNIVIKLSATAFVNSCQFMSTFIYIYIYIYYIIYILIMYYNYNHVANLLVEKNSDLNTLANLSSL